MSCHMYIASDITVLLLLTRLSCCDNSVLAIAEPSQHSLLAVSRQPAHGHPNHPHD